MSNRSSLKRVESGLQAIGTTIRRLAISGYPALGCSHPKSVCSGRPGIGDGATAGIFGTTATGAQRVDFTAASLTDSAIQAGAIPAVIGKVGNFITTPR